MYNKSINLGIIGCILALSVYAGERPTRQKADNLFFHSKKELLTAKWDIPFGYELIKSNHAPLGPFLGNGDVGIVSYTSVKSQTLQISKVDFVTDGWKDWAGDGAAALPAGGIQITVESDSAAGFHYEMDQLKAELHMHSGTLNPVKMNTWMGTEKNYIVTELTTESELPVSISVVTYAESASPQYTTTSQIRKDIAQVTRRSKSDENVRWVSQVGISTRVIGSETTTERISDSKIRTTFILTKHTPVYVLTFVSGGGTHNDARLLDAYCELKSCNNHRIKKLKENKKNWWANMWSRSYVETNDSLLNRHYLSSIYLMASAYNEHSPACGGMYGVWNMSDRMMYHGDIHLNYNSQAGFYSVFSANRPELALPFFDFIEKMLPDGRRRAQEDMGTMHPSWKGKSCRGFLFPVSALGIGYFYGGYWQQTMNAPFNVPLFSWYYEYTKDKDFLLKRAYPYIRECGDFYEDYLDKEKYGNSYRYTITTGGHENSWDLNPPSDLAFVEQVFSLLLRYSQVLDIDAERRGVWQDILNHLPEYKVIMPTKEPNQGLPVYAKNESGWDWPSHVIQMHPVYPCEVLNLHSDSISLQLARNTLYYYEVSQQGFTETMNELGLSAFVMGARIGFSPEILIEKMRILIQKANKNFLITDGHHCLEKTTVVETINSMMLQSVEGILYLFPCWPQSPAAFTRLRAKGAFLVSANYNGEIVTELQIESEKGDMCQLQTPWPGKKITVMKNGKPVPTEQHGEVCSFKTQKKGIYKIYPEQ